MAFKTAKRVLVFNPSKKLIAIFHSATATARTFGMNVQPIHYACTGECVSSNGLYFRYLDPEIEVTLEDLGSLKLEAYDELCGVERKVYKNKSMSRAGMKYRKHYVLTKTNENGKDNC